METKPAIYTTEFWLTLIGSILMFLNTSGAWNYLPGTWGKFGTTLATAILGLGYFTSRGIAKNKGTFDPTDELNYTLLPTKSKMRATRQNPQAPTSTTIPRN